MSLSLIRNLGGCSTSLAPGPVCRDEHVKRRAEELQGPIQDPPASGRVMALVRTVEGRKITRGAGSEKPRCAPLASFT